MTPTLLILGSKMTLFTDSAPLGVPFEGEPEDDWLVQVRREPKTGQAHHIDCSGRAWKAICKAAEGLSAVDQQSVLERFLSNQTALKYAEGFRNDLPPGQMRDRLLGKPEPTEEEKTQRRATMDELFANLKPGTVRIPSRLGEFDLPGRFLEAHKALQDFELGEDASRVDDLDGFPDEQAKRFWDIGPDGIRLGPETEGEPTADADEVAARLARYREGFEALERAYNAHTHVQSESRTGPVFPIPASEAIFHVSTSPDLLLQALYRWGKDHAGQHVSLSPKLFALLDSRCFPDGTTVLAKFLATARVVQPYFSVEVDVFGLTGEEILAGETWPRRSKPE